MLISQYIKTLLQYRADFFISVVGVILTNFIGLVTFGVIFTSIQTIHGWTFYEIVFIYAFAMLAITPQEMLISSVWFLSSSLREGVFIKYYFRPLNMMFYYMSEIFDFKHISRFILGLAAFIYAAEKLHIQWSPLKILLLLITLISASLIMMSIMLLTSSLSFFFTNTNSLLVMALRLREFATYPTTIYNSVFRFIFTFIIPIGFIAFYPSQLFLRPDSFNFLVYLSPFMGVLMFFLAYKVWMRGANSYTGTGS